MGKKGIKRGRKEGEERDGEKRGREQEMREIERDSKREGKGGGGRREKHMERNTERKREMHVASYLAWNSFVHSECDIFSMESQRQCVQSQVGYMHHLSPACGCGVYLILQATGSCLLSSIISFIRRVAYQHKGSAHKLYIYVRTFFHNTRV